MSFDIIIAREIDTFTYFGRYQLKMRQCNNIHTDNTHTIVRKKNVPESGWSVCVCVCILYDLAYTINRFSV